jgi:hypothetical protein
VSPFRDWSFRTSWTVYKTWFAEKWLLLLLLCSYTSNGQSKSLLSSLQWKRKNFMTLMLMLFPTSMGVNLISTLYFWPYFRCQDKLETDNPKWTNVKTVSSLQKSFLSHKSNQMLDMVIVEYYTGKDRTEELIMKADFNQFNVDVVPHINGCQLNIHTLFLTLFQNVSLSLSLWKIWYSSYVVDELIKKNTTKDSNLISTSDRKFSVSANNDNGFPTIVHLCTQNSFSIFSGVPIEDYPRSKTPGLEKLPLIVQVW